MLQIQSDRGVRLRLNEDGDLAPETARAYRREWKRWERWCARNHTPPMPATQRHMVRHFDEMLRVHGLSPAAVRQAGSAIRRAHAVAGLTLEHAMPATRIVLRRALREGRVARPKQVRPLRRTDVKAICLILNDRGRMMDRDRAILLVGYCALLRVSELAALEWPDFREERDGTGRLEIRRGKSDQDGVGAVQFLSRDAVDALCEWRDWRGEAVAARLDLDIPENPDRRIFRLGASQIRRRIKWMARLVGIRRVSGHSLRVGCAHDLLDGGATTGQIQHAGRWKSPAMPAYYARGSEAGRGAVAKMLGEEGTVL